MTFLWTKNNRFKKDDIITWALEEPVSHFGILFSNNKVVHWSFFGFQCDSYEKFIKRREIILAIQSSDISNYEEMSILEDMSHKYRGSLYDYAYVLWLTFRAFLLKFFRKPIPFGEPWADTKKNMICHEALEGLPDSVRPGYDRNKANTPYRLFIELKGDK